LIENLYTFVKNIKIEMETLMIQSKSKSDTRLLSALARKLGAHVYENNGKFDETETHYASESALAKDWLTIEEDRAWVSL